MKRLMLSVCAAAAVLTGGAAQAQSVFPVEWTNLVKASASAGTVQKTGLCGTCADAGATSSAAIAAGGGYAEFVPGAGARLYAGLGTSWTAATDPALIDFAFSFWPDGGWDVRERNVYRTEGRFVAGDVFRVALESGAVKYYKNGALVYTSTAIPGGPLVLDTTLVGTGATVASAVITAAPAPPPPPVAIVTSSLPDGAATVAYSSTVQATGGGGTYVWTVVAGALPAGLTLESATGTICGVPAVSGLSTFTLRATDPANTANAADAPLSLAVAPPPPDAVIVDTTTLPRVRMAAIYGATLHASGGSGTYAWSVSAGAMPPGLSMDPAAGTIAGIPSESGRFTFSVRATDAVNPSRYDEQTLALDVLAAAAPSTYESTTDRLARAKPAAPPLGAAGSSFVDPTFGSRLLRVTDGSTRPGLAGRSYRTPSGTHTNAWSADGRYFYAVSTDGTILAYSFDSSTMSAARVNASPSGDGGLTLRFFNEPTFSYVTPGIAYGTYNGAGATLHSIDQYDFVTGQYKQILDLASVVGSLVGTYVGGVGASAGPTEKIAAFFGGAGQDQHFILIVFDRDHPSNQHLVNTIASTLDGQPAGTLLDFRIHAIAIDRSGRYVTIYPTAADTQAPRSAAPAYVWDTEASTFTAVPVVEARSGGHDAYGYGTRVNQDCCTSSTWDAAQWQLRSLATPLATADLISPVLLPKEVYLADHPSWHNAQSDRLVPFIDANYRYGGNTTEWRAWDEEIIAVQTDAAGSGAAVWRFAHHHSAVANDSDPSRIYFWYTPRMNVSPDGRWALFTSNWGKTLGTDPGGETGGTSRQDLFLVELHGTSASPPPPPPPAPMTVTTTSLPAAVSSQPYSTMLQATGGIAPYQWAVDAGALPPGLTLDGTTGTISGTAAKRGTWSFTIKATDSAAQPSSATQVLSIQVRRR
jgi:hypothetical protein